MKNTQTINKRKTILAIETSCDETAAAVVVDGVQIHSNITATSAGLHAKTGGVIPEEAARKQIQAIIPVIVLALQKSGFSKDKIDALAVTSGPGLIGSLLVGVETAKTLAFVWNKPILPVNHLVGHLYANWISESPTHSPKFPALGLVVSGGHTDLVLMESHSNITLLGSTRDDAAGEAFDKTARLLGLPYPGGPNLSKIADEYIKEHPTNKLTLLPRPMIRDKNFDWSFSGLKTAVLREVNELAGENESGRKLSEYAKFSDNTKLAKHTPRIAAEIQEAIVEVLTVKTLIAVREFQPKSLLIAGGVAANRRLRERFTTELAGDSFSVNLFIPPPILCTDNAAYIASAAYYTGKEMAWQSITANPQLTITDAP